MNFDNFLEYFENNCVKHPSKVALVFHPEGEAQVFTFEDIRNKISLIKEQLETYGIRKYSRVLLLSSPTPDFYFFTLALMAIGATPVFIEAKKEKLITRILTTKSNAMLIDHKLSLLKYLLPPLWFKKTFIFNIDRFGIYNINMNSKNNQKPCKLDLAKMESSDPLLISFTTGSTGRPKAADRNYKVSYHQYVTSLNYWKNDSEDVDLTFFPNIILQNLGIGVTTLVPDMLKRDISSINFEVFEEIIKNYKVTRISLPPGYLNQICNQFKNPISSVKQLITGGAAVDKYLAVRTLKIFPKAYANVVYGSTEAEPISFIDLKNLALEESFAINVGQPIPEISMQFLDPTNNTINKQSGEILIAGNHVVKRYLNNNVDNSIFKHRDSEGTIWHKTGDIGYLNSKQELIIRGRKKHVLKGIENIYYSLEVETQLSQTLSEYYRTAIIQNKKQLTLVYLEGKKSTAILEEAEFFLKSRFKSYRIKFIKKIPVDNRHHWKIDYEKLK